MVAMKIGGLEWGNYLFIISGTLGLFWYQSLALY